MSGVKSFVKKWAKIGNFLAFKPIILPEDKNFSNFFHRIIFYVDFENRIDNRNLIGFNFIVYKNCYFHFFRQNDENPNF